MICGRLFLVKKYTNKKFGFGFEYSGNDWEPREIEGQNPGVELLNRHYLDDTPLIVMRVWLYPQWSDDFVIKKVGKMRWVDHPQHGKSLEAYFKQKDFIVDFLLTGKCDKDVTREFKTMVGTFKKIDEEK